MNEFELTDADAAIVAEICENWTEFRLRSEFAAAREPVAEHNDMVKAIPPDRTVPMPGKMSRSATRPPFGLPEGAGSRPHLASVFQGRRKSNNIHASSGVIWGIPAKTCRRSRSDTSASPKKLQVLSSTCARTGRRS